MTEYSLSLPNIQRKTGRSTSTVSPIAVTGGYMHRFFLFEPCCKIEREKIFATLSVAFLFLRFDLQQIRCILDRSKNFATVFLRPLNHYKIFRHGIWVWIWTEKGLNPRIVILWAGSPM